VSEFILQTAGTLMFLNAVLKRNHFLPRKATLVFGIGVPWRSLPTCYSVVEGTAKLRCPTVFLSAIPHKHC